MVGYLAGPRIGSRCYNIVHTYTLPLTLGAAGFWTGRELALLVALVWAGHIGADRLVGYGLKFERGLQTDPPLDATVTSDSTDRRRRRVMATGR